MLRSIGLEPWNAVYSRANAFRADLKRIGTLDGENSKSSSGTIIEYQVFLQEVLPPRKSFELYMILLSWLVYTT